MKDWNKETQAVYEYVINDHDYMEEIVEIVNNVKKKHEKYIEEHGIPLTNSLYLAEALSGWFADYLHPVTLPIDTLRDTDFLTGMFDIAMSNVHWKCVGLALQEQVNYREAMSNL